MTEVKGEFPKLIGTGKVASVFLVDFSHPAVLHVIHVQGGYHETKYYHQP